MNCLFCHHEIQDNSKACPKCGRKIPRCPTCGVVIARRMAYCTQDGSRLPDTVLALFDPPQEPVTTPQEPVTVATPNMQSVAPAHSGTEADVGRKRNLKPFLFGGAAVVCVLIGILFGMPRGGKAQVAVPQQQYASASSQTEKSKQDSKSAPQTEQAAPTPQPQEQAAEQSAKSSVVVEEPDVLLFSSDAAENVAQTEIMGATLAEAVRDRWGGEWISLYYFGTSDPSAGYVAARTHNIPIDTWLRDYVTFEKAKSAGWGEEWLSLISDLANPKAEQEPEEEYGSVFVSFINNCHTQYFSRADLEGFDAGMAILARNAPYAHAGRKFANDDIRAFFEQFDWYRPTIEPSQFQETMLNDYMLHNKDIVVAYEKEMGYK